MRILPGVAVAFLGVFIQACGGSGGGGTPPPTTPPPTTGANPCLSALTTELSAPAAIDQVHRANKRAAMDRDPRYNVIDAVSLHKEVEGWRARPGARTVPNAQVLGAAAGPDAVDIGEIAVVPDTGDLIAPPNNFDLGGAGLRFTRNGAGGYDVRRIDGAFRGTLGRQLTLGDDDSVPAPSVFSFTFYGKGQTAAFVNADGNVTFEEEDKASTDRNVSRLLTGPPRVAPFLADLDPTGGGKIFVNAVADQYTATWCGVRGFESARSITTQLTLLPDGTIEMKFADTGNSLTDAVVGISPGRTGTFTAVNLSEPGPSGGGASAVGERFAARPQLDNVAVSKKFYTTHGDIFDQLVIWTDASVIAQGAFAFETTVANEIRGIGVPIFDAARDFGSGGRLRSLAVMDFLGKYPDDPNQKVLGENTTLSVLGQEVGHRWLAFLEFRKDGARSDLLLGRDQAHWSFFFDSDASVMEGNDIEDLGGGAFRTIGAVNRFSLLDQYAMGLVPESGVPPFFYVESPTNLSVNRNRESSPQVGVSFNGTRREVLIQDVVAIHGPRQPSAAESSKIHRQAFIYVTSAGRNADPGQVDKLDRIRRQWEEFFLRATDGRMR
ncbi:MAG TPA: hypothetical protein VNJ03_00725, partial [Vicinamibacterales bacterium]|nr:hypothetical protein [Vicinamibacterales bacterium]